MKKRILICEFHQENNTFNPIVTPTERFNAGDVLEGEAPLRKLMEKPTTVHGGVDAITEAGGEIIPTIFMRSGSGGRVADEAFAHFCDRIRYYAETVGEFDGIYAALHGATSTESCDDACGEILALLRSLAGDKPIAASCDLHAKITKKMLQNADFICGYNTYPHVDFYETGYRAASFCMAKLKGEIAYCAASCLPMLVPPAGYTTLQGSFKTLMDSGKAMVQDGTLLDVSIFPVQPWLDVEELQSYVLTVAKDPEVAKEKAAQLAAQLWKDRDEMWPELTPVAEIIAAAEANTSGKPVILADSADSPNGGAVGDSPVTALALQEKGSTLKAAMFIRDAAATAKAFRLGVGATDTFSVGASLTPDMPGPFVAEGTVLMLHEYDAANGKYPELGRAAAIRFGNIYIVVCENGSSSSSPDFYRHFGIAPEECDLLVVKANTSFRAPYAPVSDLIYVADTPGAGASNLRKLTFHKLSKGTYPYDLPEDLVPTAENW